MARVKLEPGTGIAGLTGQVGNLVFRTMADGQTYAQQAPALGQRPGSAAQQQWRRDVFKPGVKYGNE